jgi:hypothetical protein
VKADEATRRVEQSLAVALLFLIGTADMLIAVQSLIQFVTPDGMHGRVFAINALFVNCAGQLGTFESGAIAASQLPIVSAPARPNRLASLSKSQVFALKIGDRSATHQFHIAFDLGIKVPKRPFDAGLPPCC